MVHALEESWRVLAPHGRLLDLRPLSTDSLLEVIAAEQVQVAGPVDFSPGLPDDAAADEAIETVLHQRAFAKDEVEQFDFAYYWDTLNGATEYVETRWSDAARLPASVLEEARALVEKTTASAQIRIRLVMQLASYMKAGQKSSH